MAKHSICAILTVFTLFIATQINVNQADEDGELLLEYICLNDQKLTKIHFYFQDVVGGPNSTVYSVARATISNDIQLSFGNVLVFDCVVTAAPGADSEKLGKAQGIAVSADRESPAMAMNYNIAFTAGKYNGSSLSFAGRNTFLDQKRYVAVVGGSGIFRYTRGGAVVSTHSFQLGEDSSVHAVLEYTVYATYCPSIDVIKNHDE